MDAPKAEAERDRLGVPATQSLKIWIGERRAERRKSAAKPQRFSQSATRRNHVEEKARLNR
jgi:hypothetical protein